MANAFPRKRKRRNATVCHVRPERASGRPLVREDMVVQSKCCKGKNVWLQQGDWDSTEQVAIYVCVSAAGEPVHMGTFASGTVRRTWGKNNVLSIKELRRVVAEQKQARTTGPVLKKQDVGSGDLVIGVPNVPTSSSSNSGADVDVVSRPGADGDSVMEPVDPLNTGVAQGDQTEPKQGEDESVGLKRAHVHKDFVGYPPTILACAAVNVRRDAIPALAKARTKRLLQVAKLLWPVPIHPDDHVAATNAVERAIDVESPLDDVLEFLAGAHDASARGVPDGTQEARLLTEHWLMQLRLARCRGQSVGLDTAWDVFELVGSPVPLPIVQDPREPLDIGGLIETVSRGEQQGMSTSALEGNEETTARMRRLHWVAIKHQPHSVHPAAALVAHQYAVWAPGKVGSVALVPRKQWERWMPWVSLVSTWSMSSHATPIGGATRGWIRLVDVARDGCR